MSRRLQPDGVGVFSGGIARIPHLRSFLGARRVVYRPHGLLRAVDQVVGWGCKPNTEVARRFADEQGLPYVRLEDGFVRSLGLGVEGAPPLSMVIDDLGMHYDATRPSRLETMLREQDFDSLELERARRVMQDLHGARLSKYNHQPDICLGPKTTERVLVVDQTAGDLSLELGLCVPGGFEAMLEAALREHPHAEIVVKAHPDVLAGRRDGHFGHSERVRFIDEPAHPPSLLAQVDRVYVMTSLVGFEALLAGLPVTCFGVPFYAGWGLTRDRAAVPTRRDRRRTLEEVFLAAYLRYARYVDPETGEPCELERIIEHLEVSRRLDQASRGTWVCVGFSRWKRAFLRDFLASRDGRVLFRSPERAAAALTAPDSRLLIWGTKHETAMLDLAERTGRPLYRSEDAFLRSVGLGSDLHTPASLVIDPLGLYYDPEHPSELERILTEDEISTRDLDCAVELRERIVRSGVSKYNVGVSRPVAVRAGGRLVVLVVGQVEDDASIARGCVDVRTNAGLLRLAREARPDAWVLFKPHPDVVSGNRVGAVADGEAREWADEVVPGATLADCLRVADEVHTMTSLVGFEALLRDKAVVVYGLPFYAGWGLTQDRHPHPRRRRRRTLDELVAATLIHYPRYISPNTHRYTTPRVIVEHLARSKGRRASALEISWAGRQLRKFENLARGALRAR